MEFPIANMYCYLPLSTAISFEHLSFLSKHFDLSCADFLSIHFDLSSALSSKLEQQIS
jgi:hypothetical protein